MHGKNPKRMANNPSRIHIFFMFQITFLGTSGGTPTVERGMPALALKYESDLLLFDCGEGTQRQLMRYKVGYGSVDAIFISHPHLDHYLGLFGYLETLRLSSPSPRHLDLFLPRGVEIADRYPFATVAQLRKKDLLKKPDYEVSAIPVKHCRDSFCFIFRESDRIKFHEEKAHSLGMSGTMFKEIQKKGKVKTASGEVLLSDVSWVKPGRKIVYSGDSAAGEEIIEAAQGADLLIHEATFDKARKTEALERLHSTAEDAAGIAKRAGVKRLILTHISPRYPEPSALLEEARAVFPDTEIAFDGMKVDL